MCDTSILRHLPFAAPPRATTPPHYMGVVVAQAELRHCDTVRHHDFGGGAVGL